MLGYKKTDDAGTNANASNETWSANRTDTTTSTNEALLYAYKPAKAGKFHDYFTSCLPYPQRGTEVTLPMTGNATVYYGNYRTGKPYTVNDLISNLEWTPQVNDTASLTSNIWRAGGEFGNANTPARAIVTAKTPEVGGINLIADLSEVSATSIQDLRMAIALQHPPARRWPPYSP